MRTIKYIGVSILVFLFYACVILYIDSRFNDYFRTQNEIIALVIGVAIVAFTGTIIFNRREVWGPRIISTLDKKGLQLLKERPLTIGESFKYLDWTPQPTILINGRPIQLVGKRLAYRILTVTDDESNVRQLCVEITLNVFTGKVKVDLVKEIRD